jgi:hypothetical protein
VQSPGATRPGIRNSNAGVPIRARCYKDSFLISRTTSFAILKVPGLCF